MGRTCVSRSQTFYLERDKYRLRCLCFCVLRCKKKKKLRKHAALCVYTQRANKLMSFLRYVRDFTVCMCAWLAGPVNRHWVGRVEGLHRLRLLTQFWQNGTPRAPRNPAGGAQRCNPIPSIQHGTVKNARRRACQGHSSICSYSSTRAFFFLFFSSE